MKPKTLIAAFLLADALLLAGPLSAQQKVPENDVTAPLHFMQPEHPVPYGKPEASEITSQDGTGFWHQMLQLKKFDFEINDSALILKLR